jgi:hypothetical protein
MKRFIRKTVLFILPLVILISPMEPLLRNIPNDYSYKMEYLTNNSNNITKLFLGNSHAFSGINPDYISGNSFNAGHLLQTIDLDYKILTKFDYNWEKLKIITIPIDYATLFASYKFRDDAYKKNYNIYYKMHLSYSLPSNFELLSLRFRSNLKNIYAYYFCDTSFVTCSKLGYFNNKGKKFDLVESGKKTALRYTIKDLSELDNNLNILEKFIDFATKNNIKILFYTSPAYKTFVSNIDKSQMITTFEKMTKIANNNSNCTYINFFEDARFTSDDFRDCHHLNTDGATKFSLIMNDLISEIL